MTINHLYDDFTLLSDLYSHSSLREPGGRSEEQEGASFPSLSGIETGVQVNLKKTQEIGIITVDP